jgi:hypothetical protein
MRPRSSPSSVAAASGSIVVQTRAVLPLAISRRRKPARSSSKRAKASSNVLSPAGRMP